MFRKLLIITMLLALPLCINAMDSKSKINIDIGGSFPMEKLSENASPGAGATIGYERVLSDHISVVGKWSFTKNNLKDTTESVKVNAGEAEFKYYFQPLFEKVKVIPYFIFSGGVTHVDNQIEATDPFTIVSSAFGLGINWEATKVIDIYGEGRLHNVDNTKRLVFSGGLSLPFDFP